MLTEKISGATFDQYFIRQQDSFSCGPACLATIARLQGLDAAKNYQFFSDLLLPCNKTGTHPLYMLEACREHLPLTAAGNGAYAGGLALAYITSPKAREGDHYVVFLARRDDQVIYYDPFDHELFKEPINAIKWHSTFDWMEMRAPLKQWAANFMPVPGLTFEFLEPFALRDPDLMLVPEQQNTSVLAANFFRVSEELAG